MRLSEFLSPSLVLCHFHYRNKVELSSCHEGLVVNGSLIQLP